MVTDPSGAGARRGFEAVARQGIVQLEPRVAAPLGPHDVRVEVEYAALGSYPPSGRDEALGQEYGGRIVEIGREVDSGRLGTRAIGLVRAGAVASEVVVPAESAYPLADRFSTMNAPFSLTAGMTSVCIDRRFEIGPGRVALVLAPANATGCLLAGKVRRRGGLPVAWTVDPGAVELLRRCGFAHVIVSDDLPDREALEVVTDGRGADLIVGSRMQPEGPWSSVVSLLSETGVALRRPATPLGDWDPARALVYETLSDAISFFWPGEGSIEAALVPVLEEFGDEVLGGSITMPIREFPLDDLQQAYELSTDAHIPEGIIVRVKPT